MNVYGRRRAKRTIHIVISLFALLPPLAKSLAQRVDQFEDSFAANRRPKAAASDARPISPINGTGLAVVGNVAGSCRECFLERDRKRNPRTADNQFATAHGRP
jgi:hypothetical protein